MKASFEIGTAKVRTGPDRSPLSELVEMEKFIYILHFPSGDSHESSGWYETAEDASVVAQEQVDFFNLYGWL